MQDRPPGVLYVVMPAETCRHVYPSSLDLMMRLRAEGRQGRSDSVHWAIRHLAFVEPQTVPQMGPPEEKTPAATRVEMRPMLNLMSMLTSKPQVGMER